MSVVGLASHLTRVVGIFTISLVAAIPLITLSSEATTYLESDGMRIVSSPVFVQTLIFGTTYAAIGEMATSFGVSCLIGYLLYYFFTKDGGAYAKKFVKANVVRRVQENLLHYKQPTPESSL